MIINIENNKFYSVPVHLLLYFGRQIKKVKFKNVADKPCICVSPSAGACGSVVVKALCYKPESRGFDTR
jgi:hypothetical protein